MITAIRSYALRWRHWLKKLALDSRVHIAAGILKGLAMGFCLSAASLAHYPIPLTLALVTASQGWEALLIALGGSLGCWAFWGRAGLQSVAWLAAGLTLTLVLGSRPAVRAKPLLLSMAAGLITAAAGLLFRLQLGETVPVPIYLLRVLLAFSVTWLFQTSRQNRTPLASAMLWALWVLALAQIAPTSWLCLGMVAAGALCAGAPFPAAALAGLALDLAQVTPVPMTGVLCAAWLLRQLPLLPKWSLWVLPPAAYLSLMSLCGIWVPVHLIPLTLGALLGRFLPESAEAPVRRGETGVAQVRLELAAGVFSQVQQQLMEAEPAPIDEHALVVRAAERACGGCPCRKTCRERLSAARLSPQLLHRPLLDGHDLALACRKEGRLLQELHRAQEQLRAIRAGRETLREYQGALVQQYQFLAEYLQDLSDELGRRARSAADRFAPQVTLCANRREGENGDRCQCFRSGGGRYYVLLCDGMGTGLGAMDEGAAAGALLKKLLTAGFPAEYALRSLNSLCALRGLAGAVTVDLAQLQLDTGKVFLYKWGAAPSYLLTAAGAEKIGTAGPPPGLSVTENRETVERLSLRRGETLVLCSDGIAGEEALRCWFGDTREPPGELAARILEAGTVSGGDDATVALIRMTPVP